MLSFAKRLRFDFLIIIIFSLFGISTIAHATENSEKNCEYKGTYVFPDDGKGGHAKSIEIGNTPFVAEEQLGKINLTLVHEGWSDLHEEDQESICRRLKIRKGVFRGLVTSFNQPFPDVFIPLIDHVITNGSLDSTMHTENDALDPFTIMQSGCLISAVEQVNVIEGTGRFLNATGTLFLRAKINLCTKQNRFKLLPGHNGVDSSISFPD